MSITDKKQNYNPTIRMHITGENTFQINPVACLLFMKT